MAVIVHPPDGEKVFPNGRSIFLGGPIQGAPDWQKTAFNILLRDGPADLNVFSPRRDYVDGTFVYEAQVDWETRCLYEAGTRGVILFWLAAQVEETPGRSYGQTSRFELGEWFGRAQFLADVTNLNAMPKIVVGIESGFGNARYIRRRITELLPDQIPVLDSLEETCAAALKKLAEWEVPDEVPGV